MPRWRGQQQQSTRLAGKEQGPEWGEAGEGGLGGLLRELARVETSPVPAQGRVPGPEDVHLPSWKQWQALGMCEARPSL